MDLHTKAVLNLPGVIDIAYVLPPNWEVNLGQVIVSQTSQFLSYPADS